MGSGRIIQANPNPGPKILLTSSHSLLLIGKLLWVIRKHKKVSATCPHIVVGKGGEKRKTEGMCGGTHTTFLLCLGEERNKALTIFCEAILDVAGYV